MKTDRIYLVDMQAAAQNARAFIDGMSAEAFSNDARTVRAVAFELLALGEAAKQISNRTQRSLPAIPWGDLRLVRNTVAHEHFALNPYTLWRTVVRELPPIEAALEKVLGEEK
jgi:uncharacterized protein with HEPN domain